jgi:hypothetical protein
VISEYLADREGLRGTVRRRFIALLERYGFRTARRRSWRLLLLVSTFVSTASLLLDSPFEHWVDVASWSGYFFLTAGPIWYIRRQEKHLGEIDAETEWLAYCRFLRPLILANHPGLLDRNLELSACIHDEIHASPVLTRPKFFVERGADYGWACLLGIWCNMIALLVLRHAVENPGRIWSLLPVVGFFVGPIAWALWQNTVYLLAQPDGHDVR